MIALWMLYASMVGALVTLAAAAIDRFLRGRRRAARWVWIAAMLATASVPLRLAVRRAPVIPNAPAVATRAVPVADTARAGVPSANPSPHLTSAARRRPLTSLDTPSVDRALLLLWLCTSLGLLAWVLRSIAVTAARRATWTEAEVVGRRVWQSEDVGPAVVGVFRPRIVIPAWTRDLDANAQRLMLDHEAEHIRARDPVSIAVGMMCACAMPWNVALWWQLARLRLAVEIDCDARVIGDGGRARDYAMLLVTVGERLSQRQHFAAALADGRSLLERRIVAMSNARRRSSAARAVGALAAAIVCVALACEAPSPSGVRSVLDHAPASLVSAAVPMPRYFPAVSAIDRLTDADRAWLHAALTQYYPDILSGDSPYVSASVFVDATGELVKVEAAKMPVLAAGEELVMPGLITADRGLQFGGGVANITNPAVIAEERAYHEEADRVFSGTTAELAGIRIALPQTLAVDYTAPVSTLDPFAGADPVAFQRADQLTMQFGNSMLHVNVLVFKPGRGSSADFGRRAMTLAADHTMAIAPENVAAYADSLGPELFAAVRACKPPACTPRVTRGPEPGEFGVEFDSSASTGRASGEEVFMSTTSDGFLGDAGGWAITAEAWDTLSRKPLILIDGARGSYQDVLKREQSDDIVSIRRVQPGDAVRLSSDPLAKNGAIVVVTRR